MDSCNKSKISGNIWINSSMVDSCKCLCWLLMVGHNKKPFQYAAKPIFFRGLISCKHCGCGVTGDIKKKKYIYYSCTNSKRVCQKLWTREEDLLAPLMEQLHKIQLPDAVIEEIVEYLKKAYAHEQAFFKTSQKDKATSFL